MIHMAGRGRPALSAEEKQKRKDDKAAALLSTASAKLPAEQSARDALRARKDELKEEAKAAAKDVSDHVKKMATVYGFLPKAEKINDILATMSDVEFSAVLEQVALRQQEKGRQFQLSMFVPQPGKGSTDAGEEKPVFDSTKAGSKVGGDYLPKVKNAGGPPPAPVDTGRLTDDEALKVFGATQHLAPKPSNDDDDTIDVRPDFLKRSDEQKAEVEAETAPVVVKAKPKPRSAGKTAKPKGGATKGSYAVVH
jgi:hypothetical protein